MKQALSPKEVKIIQMSLAGLIEDLEASAKDQTIPFTPSARADMKDMLLHAKGAKAKIDLAVGNEVTLEPYQDGDEDEFLTKQS